MEQLDVELDNSSNEFITGRVERTITSKEFKNGLRRLATDRTLTSATSYAGSACDRVILGEDEISERLSSLECIRVREVPNGVPHFEHEGRNDRWLLEPGEEYGKPIVFLYLRSDLTIDSGKSRLLYVCLAEVVNTLTQGMLQAVLHRVALLVQCQPEEIDDCLDDLNVKRTDNYQVVPKPGSFVPVDQHHLLKQDLVRFDAGQLVALEITDDSLYNDDDGDDDNCGIFICAQIAEIVSDDDEREEYTHLTARYRVKVGETEERIVSSNELYEFHRSADNVDGNVSELATCSEKKSEISISLDAYAVEEFDIDKIYLEIQTTLAHSLALPEEQRRAILKRLYLKWHPDKNPPHMSELCKRLVKIGRAHV